MGLIKSANIPTSAAAFSMLDVETHAKGILLRAREQAEGLLVEAQNEADSLRAQAHAEGLAAGRREGREQGMKDGLAAGTQQALSSHTEQFTTLLSALMTAVTEVEGSREMLATVGLNDVVTLALAIARRVTKRQGMISPEVLTENLREAMKLVAHGSDVRIAIHPEQRAVLDSLMPTLRMEWPSLKHVELINDDNLAPGGCRVFTHRGSIDADLDGQLDRVIDELMPRAEESGR